MYRDSWTLISSSSRTYVGNWCTKQLWDLETSRPYTHQQFSITCPCTTCKSYTMNACYFHCTWFTPMEWKVLWYDRKTFVQLTTPLMAFFRCTRLYTKLSMYTVLWMYTGCTFEPISLHTVVISSCYWQKFNLPLKYYSSDYKYVWTLSL